MKVIARNNIRLIVPTDFKRNAYIRVSAEILPEFVGSINDAWAEAVDFCYSVVGTIPTEDNTIGQYSQTKDGGSGAGRVFSFGCNLYGKPVRALKQKINNFQ